MDKNPLVSVIVPTRNSERTLERCLMSIRNQTYKNIEIIVVDNNSIDRTKEIASKYADKVYNKGPERSSQRNFGVMKSKGEYVLVHDSDIYFPEECVMECISLVFSKNAKAIILPEKSIGEGFWAKVKAFERSFYVGNDLIEAPRFFHKKLYLDVGGYDETLTACEDWDLTNKIRRKGVEIYRTEKMLLHDEGKLTLAGSKKKSYYAKWINEYKKRYPQLAKKQFNPFYRFPLNKLFIKGIAHPSLLVSMVLMKYNEWKSTR